MTVEQELLKHCGHKDYMQCNFIGIEESPIGEKNLFGGELVRAHFKRLDDSDIYINVVKLNSDQHPLASGYYVIDGKLTSVIV